MNILHILAIKDLKQNKRRTIATIVGIIFSVALICFISTLVASFQASMITNIQKTIGNYHISLRDISTNEAEIINNNKETIKAKTIGLSQTIGAANYETQNKSKLGIIINAFDDVSLQNRDIQLIDGRLPKSETELVISEYLINNANEKLEIGSKLNLNIEKVKVEKVTSGVEEDGISLLPDGEEKITYTVVGIVKQTKEETNSPNGYIGITKLSKTNKNRPCEITILMENTKEVYSIYNLLNSHYKDGNTKINNELLIWQGEKDGMTDKVKIELLGTFIIFIIIIISILLIKNSFQISITERTKDFGMLASIGISSRQVKKIVLFDGLIYSLISIPIGVILGIGMVFLGIVILSNTFISNVLELQFVLSMPILILSVLLSIITIFISCIKPANIASKVLPIKAIRENTDILIDNKEAKTSKIISSLFGIEGDITSKNMKRNKKKYRATTISICITVILLIAASSIIKYIFTINSTMYPSGYNIDIGLISNGEKKLYQNPFDYYKRVKQLEGIKEYSAFTSIKAKVKRNSDILTQQSYALNRDIDIIVLACDSTIINEYLKTIGMKIEEFRDSGILVNKYKENYSSNTGYKLTKLETEDNLPVIIEEKEYNLKIKNITDENLGNCIMQLNNSNKNQTSSFATLIISAEKLNEIQIKKNSTINQTSMRINVTDANKLEKQIRSFSDVQNINIHNFDREKQENKKMMNIISIFLYGLLLMITAIGVTNIFNTITTSMNSRKDEFKTLLSIGMTQKQFRKMINCESILYSLKSLLISISIGLIISVVIYILIKENNYVLSYYFPVVPIFIAIIGVCGIIFITMKITGEKYNK